MPIQTINTRAEMAALAESLGVRDDWHEPDEQGVTAELHEGELDNAMGEPDEGEAGVTLRVNGRAVAYINLATLLALASGTA